MSEDIRKQVLHGERFLLHAGVCIRAIEPVIVALPPEILGANERMGDVIHADDDAKLGTTEDKQGKTITIQVLLEPGQGLRITKSCEVMFLSAYRKPVPSLVAISTA